MATKTKAGAKAKKPAAKATTQPRAKKPKFYRAEHDHEIEAPGGGVKRVEAGMIVVEKDGEHHAMPPERFAEAHPGVKI